MKLRLRNENKISKVSHKEAIYGQTRQILSKTETEGRRRLQFPRAGILCQIKENKYKNLSLWSDPKLAKFHTRKPFMD